uniref:Sialidase-1 n=1 Tax=Branchiostoma floridae TaxID=7739 RepID=C3Y2M1_BRAFL|eukprot:XP_002609273.1 hypothetical protein BRAFLDRAFT_86816 [Branchiostoma floridae]
MPRLLRLLRNVLLIAIVFTAGWMASKTLTKYYMVNFTWIMDDGKPPTDVYSNLGTVFVDDTKAIIFLMYVSFGICPTRSVMLMNSTDDGITWGRPRNITDQVGKEYATHPSPGYGIKKEHDPAKGRLIVCGHGFNDGVGIVLLLSDDHGVTWRHGAFVRGIPFHNNTDGDFAPAECQPVELPDGSLYLVVRNQHQYKYHCKMTMRSFDGGETLPRRYMFLDRSLVEPKISSGLWYHNGTMFYSGPKSETERRRLCIRWSHDYGNTWTSGTEIWGDLAGYSTLMMLPHDTNHLYILYERGWIMDDGKPPTDVYSNLGTVLVDDTKSIIFLMYISFGIRPMRSLMLMNSTDDGITWGRPRNITDQVGKHFVTHPSPGHGIQKEHDPAKGRLIVCGHGFNDGLGIVLLLSDDHGVTWRHGAFVPSVPYQNNLDGDFNPAECQPVELPDGSLYLVVRNQHQYKYHCKMTMRSFDGGETLPEKFIFLDRSLVEPRISSGWWYHNGTMFYSGPKSETGRGYCRFLYTACLVRYDDITQKHHC